MIEGPFFFFQTVSRRSSQNSTSTHSDEEGLRAVGRTAWMYAMARLRTAELLANAPIDPEAHLDAARVDGGHAVAGTRESPGQLPLPATDF